MTPRLRLVPGLGLAATAWRPTLAALSEELRREAAVVELPGYGQRAERGADLTPPAAALLLLETGRADPGTSVLVGHSASCQVVVHAARRHPDRVAGLVLVGPTTDPRAPGWPALARRWLATARHEPPRQVPALVRQYARTGAMTMYRTMDAARHDDVRRPLAGAGGPVLVVRGRHDRICPGDWADHLVTVAPGRGRAVTLEAGGHMVPSTHGSLVARVIDDFVATLGR